MTFRPAVLAAALAVLTPVVALTASDAAADTTRPEFFVGTALPTAKADHNLPTGVTPTATAQVKKGAQGKVTKVINSGGKPVKLDVKIGDQVFKGVPVAKIRLNFDYVKL